MSENNNSSYSNNDNGFTGEENYNNTENYINPINEDPIEQEIQWLDNQQEGVKTDNDSNTTAKNFLNALNTACNNDTRSWYLEAARKRIKQVTTETVEFEQTKKVRVIRPAEPKQEKNYDALETALSWLFFRHKGSYETQSFEPIFKDLARGYIDAERKINDINILLHHYYTLTVKAMPEKAAKLEPKLEKKITDKLKTIAKSEGTKEKIIDNIMSVFSTIGLDKIITWLNENQTNETLLDIFCQKVNKGTITMFPCKTDEQLNQSIEAIKVQLEKDQEAATEEFNKMQKKQNGALYNHYPQSDENNSNEVLKEDEYNNFIRDALEHGTNLQAKYRGKKIQDLKTFQKKTNVCWLRRLFNCCTPTIEIAFDDFIRKKINNNNTTLSCVDLVAEFNRSLRGN